ncbi:MAG: histidine kinase, partial [Lachnospiraceae bacterium]|nr:histidine kinase [Lachnospiraceae bacterium]
MLSTASEHADLATDRFSNDLDSLLTKLDVITTSFQTDSIYKTLFNATDYKDISSDIINQVSENVSYIKSLYPDIADIAFVNNVVHWSSLYSEEDLLSMYKETVSNGKNLNRGLGLKKSSFLPFKDKSYYVYCSQTYYLGHPIGCIFFSLDMDKLSLTSSSNENAYYYLMDTNGNYHALNSSSKSVSQAIIPICQANYSKVTEGSSFSNKSKSYLIKMDYSSTASCYIISAVNITSVNKSSQGTLIKVTMIVVAIVFFVLLMLITLYVSLINPLNQFSNIIKTMEKERTRHLSAPIDIDGCMEVHDLGTAFTNMFSTIDELNVQIFDASSKLYEEKIRGQATEISYFRSQINPHFLYNVLELIRSQALLKDAPEIANIAIAMGKMYRYNTKGAPIVP